MKLKLAKELLRLALSKDAKNVKIALSIADRNNVPLEEWLYKKELDLYLFSSLQAKKNNFNYHPNYSKFHITNMIISDLIKKGYGSKYRYQRKILELIKSEKKNYILYAFFLSMKIGIDFGEFVEDKHHKLRNKLLDHLHKSPKSIIPEGFYEKIEQLQNNYNLYLKVKAISFEFDTYLFNLTKAIDINDFSRIAKLLVSRDAQNIIIGYHLSNHIKGGFRAIMVRLSRTGLFYTKDKNSLLVCEAFVKIWKHHDMKMEEPMLEAFMNEALQIALDLPF